MHSSSLAPIGAVVLALAVLGVARAQPAVKAAAPPRITNCDVDASLTNVLRSCEEAIRNYPDVARFHANLAGAYALLHRYDEARRSFEKASELGSASAMGGLGSLYEYGRGVSQDFAEAKRWYEKAAALDDHNAAFKLGVIYEKGLGVPESLAEAANWYRKAAKLGSLDAELALSRLWPRDGTTAKE